MAIPTISGVSGAEVTGTSFQDYLSSLWDMMFMGRGLTAEIGGQTATNTNATLLTTGKDWYGGGYNFDGTAFLDFGDILNVPNGSSYTFAVIFKTTATGARPMLARFSQGASFLGYALRLVNGSVNWIIGDGVGFLQNNDTTGGWNDGSYHLAIVSGNGSGSVAMWVDNNKSTFTANANFSATSKKFFVGSTQQRTTPNYFDGDIGVVYANIGGGLLSDADATALYNATHFAINGSYDLATINSSTSATLNATPVTGETVYVYNKDGSDSYLMPSVLTSNIGTIKQFVGF